MAFLFSAIVKFCYILFGEKLNVWGVKQFLIGKKGILFSFKPHFVINPNGLGGF